MKRYQLEGSDGSDNSHRPTAPKRLKLERAEPNFVPIRAAVKRKLKTEWHDTIPKETPVKERIKAIELRVGSGQCNEVLSDDEKDELDCLQQITPPPVDDSTTLASATPEAPPNAKPVTENSSFSGLWSMLGMLTKEPYSETQAVLTAKLSETQSELVQTRRELDECRLREKSSQEALESAEEDGERMQRLLNQLSTDLEAAQSSTQEYASLAYQSEQDRYGLQDALDTMQHQLQAMEAAVETSQSHQAHPQHEEQLSEAIWELHTARENQNALNSRVESLIQERGEARAALKRLRNEREAQALPRVEFALDSFRDAVDQVSEAHVKFSGHPSVERLNEAIDNLVLEAQEHAIEAIAARGDFNTPFTSAAATRPSDNLLFAGMTKPGLTEEHHGLLLDACLHAVIVPLLYETFFKGTVSTVSVDNTDILDELFARISEAEPWAVCQRWRALTASATSVTPESAELEDFASHVQQKVSEQIAWAYGQHITTFDVIRDKILADITAVVRDAHQLSLVLKRDILSVRMMVTLNAGIDRPFDPQTEQSVWPEMGAKTGDQVIGAYGLGLGKIISSGQVVDILRPIVITTALLKEIEKEG